MHRKTLTLAFSALAAVTSPAFSMPALVPGSLSFFLPADALAQLEAQVEAAGETGVCGMPIVVPGKSTCLTTCNVPPHPGQVDPFPFLVAYLVSSTEESGPLATVQPRALLYAGLHFMDLPCGRFQYEIEIDPSALQPDSVMALDPGSTDPAEGPFTGILRLAVQARFVSLDLGVPAVIPVPLELKLEGRWSTTPPQPVFDPLSNLTLTLGIAPSCSVLCKLPWMEFWPTGPVQCTSIIPCAKAGPTNPSSDGAN
jgi:hypothetical protein